MTAEAADLREAFEERAATLEYDAGDGAGITAAYARNAGYPWASLSALAGYPKLEEGKRRAIYRRRRRPAAVLRRQDPARICNAPEGAGEPALIRAQAFGEALNPDQLERLVRYEIHLDRKLKRMLTHY